MKRTGWMPALTLTVGVTVGAIGGTALNAQQPSFKETTLLTTDLAGMEGKEVIVSRLETAPGWSHGRHYHAGHELVYVLEGSGILEVDGKSPITLKPGSISYVPPKQVHAGRNASGTAPFRFLLLRIHEKGQPISVELD